MLRNGKYQRGSATVEAAVIVPVIILSIIAVLQAGIFLCQRCLMQAAADTAAEAGSAGWRYSKSERDTNKVSIGELDNDGIYWRIFDRRSGYKEGKAAQAASGSSYGNMAGKPDVRQAAAQMTDYIVYKKLTVNLRQEYKVPAAGLLHVFGFKDRLALKASSLSIANDPTELIRNTDFVIDLEKELEKRNPAVKNAGEKARDAIQKLKEKIEGFNKNKSE